MLQTRSQKDKMSEEQQLLIKQMQEDIAKLTIQVKGSRSELKMATNTAKSDLLSSLHIDLTQESKEQDMEMPESALKLFITKELCGSNFTTWWKEVHQSIIVGGYMLLLQQGAEIWAKKMK